MVRVLLVVTGFTSVVNGVVEMNPDFETSTMVFGWFLVALGVACWALVWRMRRRGARTLLLALLAVLVLVRIYQMVRFSTFLPASGLVLPVLVFLRMRSGPAREWLDGAPATSTAPERARRLGAVGITVVLLAVISGAGLAVALWPCSLPAQAAANGLDNSQSPTSSPTEQPTGTFPAGDGVPLAYYAYVPENPVATLVFYHGSGANSRAGYLDLGKQLERFHVATYLVDIRGHGESGGPRGDAPSIGQVWRDTATAVHFVHSQQPTLPEYVGGHSAGAGLVLNSLDQFTDPVAGYVFLAPDFGLRSDTTKVSGGANFATVCLRPIIANTISNHVLDGHAPALSFAYDAATIQRAKLVAQYTVNMTVAQNPSTSAQVLAGITVPIGVWIGTDDEVFDPDKVLAYARQAGTAARSTFATIPGDNHLGVLENGADRIGAWITRDAPVSPTG